MKSLNNATNDELWDALQKCLRNFDTLKPTFYLDVKGISELESLGSIRSEFQESTIEKILNVNDILNVVIQRFNNEISDRNKKLREKPSPFQEALKCLLDEVEYSNTPSEATLQFLEGNKNIPRVKKLLEKFNAKATT